jgi:hypothetical protein
VRNLRNVRVINILFVFITLVFGGQLSAQNPFEVRQTIHHATTDTLKEKKSPEESIDHSNPFEIKHVPANYAIRDTLLVKKPIPITSKKTANPNFLFVTVSILLLFLTMLVVLNRSLLANIYRAILSDTFLKSVYRFQNNSQTLSYGLFYLFFILNAGLFLFLLLKQMKVDYFSSDPILFFACVGIIAAVYLMRHLVLKIIGVIFPVTKEVGYFNFTILAFNIFLGIALTSDQWLNILFGRPHSDVVLVYRRNYFRYIVQYQAIKRHVVGGEFFNVPKVSFYYLPLHRRNSSCNNTCQTNLYIYREFYLIKSWKV